MTSPNDPQRTSNYSGEKHPTTRPARPEKTGVSGNQKFKWIGKDDFHDQKGELRHIDKGAKVIVQGDTDGDGNADFEIFVAAGSLGKGDFLL